MDGVIKLQKPRYGNEQPAMMSPMPRQNEDSPAASQFNTTDKLILEAQQLLSFDNNQFQSPRAKNNGQRINSRPPINAQSNATSIRGSSQSVFGDVGQSLGFLANGRNAFDAPLRQAQNLKVPSKNQQQAIRKNDSSPTTLSIALPNGFRNESPSNQRYNTRNTNDPMIDDNDSDSDYDANGGYDSARKDQYSLRSMYDFVDVNMNSALAVGGLHQQDGRNNRFFARTFKEDNWGQDESVLINKVTMPNLAADRDEYQKELCLNLDFQKNLNKVENSEVSIDAADEAKDMLPPTPFYKIVKKDRIQIIDDYHDRCPFLEFRKSIMRTRVYINRGAQMIMMHKLFENASITVIIINSLFLAMDNPLRDPSETPAYMTVADEIFQYLYTVEMVVKIVSLGFILNKGSYIRDPWNVLDFTIVSSGYIGIILAGSGVNLSVLRSFRVIRPLRTISTIKGLRIIVSSLINAFPLLRDALLVLLFFHVIFSIAGCQLFMGALKQQCYDIQTGLINSDTPTCGGQFTCPPGFFCGKSNFNPGFGGKNFDNVMFSMQQVFQIVTKVGYTETMIYLEDSVGRWTSIYFYPIIFIGSFFLLNLTLAVIKAKFTEEMDNKKEMAQPKKKKLNDAPDSSDDEDARIKELQEKIEDIRKSKNMSPRSKENLINEMKIEHMLWEVDIKVDKRDIELKIMENQGKDNQQKRQGKSIIQGKKKASDLNVADMSEKIRILQPPPKGFSQTIPKIRQKAQQDLNYSEVYYNNDRSAYIRKKGAAPRYNDRDSSSINMRASAPVQAQTLLRIPLATSPIREDEEEHQNLTELIEFQEDRQFDLKRREQRRKLDRGGDSKKVMSNGIKTNYSISNGDTPSASGGTSKHGRAKQQLSKVFEINKNGQSNQLQGVPVVGDKKKLVFAGMNQKAVQIGVGNKSASRINASNNAHRHNERVNQAVYDSIAANFDIFEFADGQDAHVDAPERTSWSNKDHNKPVSDDELEFEIEEFNHRSAFNDNFDERRGLVERRSSGILDLDDGDQISSRATEENPTIVKRNSTDATINVTGKNPKLNSSSLHPKYVGSNFSMANNSQSKLRIKTATKNKLYTSKLVYKGNENKILSFFRGCKQLKAKRVGRDFKEEYLMIRKRPKSQEHLSHRSPYTPTHQKNNFLQNNDTIIQSYREAFDLKPKKDTNKSVRAKSIEQRKQRLLAETIQFNTRLNIMKRRRAQFFAPAIKMLDVEREDIVKEYDDYVFRKRRIKVNPEMIDEHIIRKRTLYKSASTDAIFRIKEIEAFEAKMPLGPHKPAQIKIALDLQSVKSREDILDLESQRSLFLEEDYERRVENYKNREEEIKKREEYQYVPDMEKILYERELKIMVKMTNHEYTSIEDVFEKGGKRRFITEQQKLNVARESKKKEDLRKRLPKRVPGREIILGYQKKIYQREKIFHEELLRTEFDMEDEDQDGLMSRIQHEYNINHRSHIYITGTVSVVVERPHNNHRILNANYHANIKAIRQQKKREREQNMGSQKIIPTEMLTIDTPKNGGGLYASTVNPHIQQLVVESGSMWTKVQNINFSQNQGTFSQMKNKSMPSKYSLSTKIKTGSSMMNKSQKVTDKKPQQLSDALILRRLNEEVLESRIFQALQIKKLPAKILRKQEHKILHGVKKRREPPKLEQEDLEGDESAITKIMKRKDYFLDHTVDGMKVISIARDAAFSRHKDYVEWSGQDVNSRFDPYKAKIAVSSLDSIRVWPHAMTGDIKQRRVLLKTFMRSPLVEHSMTAMVVGNTIVLSLDYYGASPELQLFNQNANFFFTIAFAIEMGLKIIAIGIKKWTADKMNFMDGSIVILSCVELFLSSGGGALSSLRSIRIFRIFRILRVARLLRGLKSMIQIVNVISRALQSFVYMTMLLFLFIFIYALLGMQVFGGTFRAEEAQDTNRFTFDSFNYAFVTSFVLLTMISWYEVLYFAYSSSLPEPVIAVYFISCIFIGNWMLLNLLLSILLDSFSVQDEEEIMTEEKKEALKDSMLDDFRYKQGEDYIDGMEEMQQEGFILKQEKKEKKKKKKVNKGEDDKKALNILEESMEVDLQELATRDQNALELKKQIFRGIDCEQSCYLFSKHFWLRILCYRTIFHAKFETFIMVIISCSSFKLVFDTYTNNSAPTDAIVVWSGRFDLVFQAIFTLEMATKIMAFGFVMDEGSYLTEAWNKLDCFIVMTGLVDSIFSGINIPFFKVLRLLRILRPLRFVSHSSNMKTLIEALLASMGSLLNVGLVILIVFLMFSILGVNLFAGKTQICTENKYLTATPEECYLARGKWETFDYNMDNVVSAIITLFIVANGEVWPEIMYTYTDISGVGTGPQKEASLYNSYFFVFFVSVSTFFFMNLFVGVLFMNFEKAQREEREAMFLNGDEIRWVDMMKMICGEKPEIIKIPKNPISRWCHNFTKDGSGFSNFIMACIILNIFTMASIYDGMSLSYQIILDDINYVFTGAFTLECVLKLTASGGAYFSSGWNKFDFFVVSSSFLDIIMNTMSASSLKVIKVGPQIARIMRVLRVSRLFKLLNKYKGLRALMQTIAFSLPSVMNAFALLTLVYFIFSVLGVFFFKDLNDGEIIDPEYMNFENFTQSLILMLRISTGEEWPKVMFDSSRVPPECIPNSTCGSSYAPAFFLCYILLQQYTMLNLFVLIILQQFDLYYLPSDNVLDRFKNDVMSFKFVWKRYSEEYEGYKITLLDVTNFFKELKGDLGMADEKDPRVVDRNLVLMNIKSDDEGFVYFNELLYKTMKRRYMPGRTKKKVLFEMELVTLEKLEKIMVNQVKESKQKEKLKAVALNPFSVMMYKDLTFFTWKQVYEYNLPKRTAHIELGLEREISDEDEDDTQEQFHMIYQTEEEWEVDELDEQYLEQQALLQATLADPLPEYEANEEIEKANVSRIADSKLYDQLKQEDDILHELMSPARKNI